MTASDTAVSPRGVDRYGYVRRIGQHVVHGRSLLRLRHQRLDFLRRRVGIDVERHLDVVKAVSDFAIHPENALNVHCSLEIGLDRPQLDSSILRDSGDTGRQATRQSDEDELDRRHTMILGCEDLRMIGVEREFGLVLLLLAETVKPPNAGLTVSAVFPLA